jgi:hypothetical protein
VGLKGVVQITEEGIYGGGVTLAAFPKPDASPSLWYRRLKQVPDVFFLAGHYGSLPFANAIGLPPEHHWQHSTSDVQTVEWKSRAELFGPDTAERVWHNGRGVLSSEERRIWGEHWPGHIASVKEDAEALTQAPAHVSAIEQLASVLLQRGKITVREALVLLERWLNLG